MSQTGNAARPSSAVRNYMLLSFAGLLLMVPVLLMKGMDLWCIFPLVLGALSLMAHWRAGPIYVLIALGLVIWLRATGRDPLTCLEMVITLGATVPPSLSNVLPTPFLDLLLSMCVLAFVAGHYRLQALVYHVVPPESRGQGPGKNRSTGQPAPERHNPRRAPGSITSWEIPLLGLVTLLCALLGEYTSVHVHELRPSFGMSPGGWQTVVFIWSSALILFVARAFFSYLGIRRATRAEALLYLQDQFWRQTRREQSRVNRWIAWARLRYLERKEEMQ